MVAGDDKGQVKVWGVDNETHNLKEIRDFGQLCEGKIVSTLFTDSSQFLYILSYHGELKKFDVGDVLKNCEVEMTCEPPKLEPLKDYGRLEPSVGCLAISPDDMYLGCFKTLNHYTKLDDI